MTDGSRNRVVCASCGAPLHVGPIGLEAEDRGVVEARPCASCSGLTRSELRGLIDAARNEIDAGGEGQGAEAVRRLLAYLSGRSSVAAAVLADAGFRFGPEEPAEPEDDHGDHPGRDAYDGPEAG